MSFIKKLDISADISIVNGELANVLSSTPWPEHKMVYNGKTYHANQLGITYRPDAEYPWYDASGSLYDKLLDQFTGQESDFTEWNSVGTYTKSIIEKLANAENTKFGRIRFMRLMPKTGLSIHADFEKRYHLVLTTNPFALFGKYTGEEVAAQCYHIPADSYFYKIDTTCDHFVFNGGWEPRIHLVICEA